MNNQLQVLENYGLLLEDHAGEPSVNVYAFAAKELYRLLIIQARKMARKCHKDS